MISRIKMKSIHVEGFRGVLKAELPTNGMTLLVGKNSTGKSSLIQSLLILAQSRDERVRTNGSILMLGDAKGNINDNAPQQSLLYRFEFEFRPMMLRHLKYLSELDVKKKIDLSKSFTLEMRFKPNPIEFSGLSIEEMTLKQDDFTVMHCVSKNVNKVAKHDIQSANKNINANLPDALRVVSVMNRKIGTTTIFLNGINPESYHFKLREDVIEKNLKKILLEEKVDKKLNNRRKSSNFSELIDFCVSRIEGRNKAEDPVFKKIYLEEFDEIKKMSSSRSVSEIIKYWEIEETGLKEKNFSTKKKKEQITEIAINLAKELKFESKFKIMPSPNTYLFKVFFPQIEEEILVEENLALASRLIGTVTDEIGRFLAGIRYLGPLRAEPKAAYGSVYTTPNTPLGINGGSTAEYLHRSFITSSKSPKKSRGRASLDAEAKRKLDRMVRTIGIGDHVEVEQVGRFGYAIKIKQYGADRDLTEMGTGASQVIPVLALLLSADDGSLVILEQPELHLHPAIQSGLAQLLYEESQRVNIICETHSEYIVTRLRRIVLEKSLEEVKNKFSKNEVLAGPPGTNVDFVWAEPSFLGNSKEVIGYNLSPTVLDKYNDILHWPSGFFDDQTGDVEAIVSAKINLLELDPD